MIRRAQRGHLKIYLGYAAGVGKTYRMLQEAHQLKDEGIDLQQLLTLLPSLSSASAVHAEAQAA